MRSLLNALRSHARNKSESFAIALPRESSTEDLAEWAFAALLRGQSLNDTVYELSARFQLGDEDAVSALHRVLAGVAAARDSAPESLPGVEKDPIGWASYDLARQNPNGVKRIMG